MTTRVLLLGVLMAPLTTSQLNSVKASMAETMAVLPLFS